MLTKCSIKTTFYMINFLYRRFGLYLSQLILQIIVCCAKLCICFHLLPWRQEPGSEAKTNHIIMTYGIQC